MKKFTCQKNKTSKETVAKMTNSSVSNVLDRDATEKHPITTKEKYLGEVKVGKEAQNDGNQCLDGRNEINEKVDVSTVVSQTKEGDESSTKVLSKNQIKKRKRYEKLMAKKKERKESEKARRIAKAEAEGRDLDQERREVEERTKSGEGHKRRQEVRKRQPIGKIMYRIILQFR